MKMTVRDIADAMTTSHEGFAGLVSDSIAFGLGRELTDGEHAQVYDITARAISDAVCQLEGVSESEDKALSPSQFCDLADYLYSYGVFSGPGGIQGNEFMSLAVIDEPTDEPEGRKIYLRDRYPFAVYDFDTGYTVLRS